MTLLTEKIQHHTLAIQDKQLEAKLLMLKSEIVADLERVIARKEQIIKRKGYSIRELAEIDGISYKTVQRRVQEMQKDKKFSKYIRDYGSYANGTYKQCLRIEWEGWEEYGRLKR